MMKLSYYIVLIVFCVVACKPSPQEEAEEAPIAEEQDITVNSIGEQLTADAKLSLRDWHGFQLVEKKIEVYTTITSGQALENAKDLSVLVRKIRDSIKVEVLDRPDFKTRLNVLYGHSLRLDDMSTILSISEEEVNEQVTKLLDAFSSVNNKVNAIYKEEKSEKEFGDQLIKLDSPEKLDLKKGKRKSPALVTPVNATQ